MSRFLLMLIILIHPLSIHAQAEKLVIIGGGPAGLTAAIFAGQAELKPFVIRGPGGQSAFIQKIENYPGFPDGISGPDFEERVMQQALRFGAHFSTQSVTSLDLTTHPIEVSLSNGTVLQTQTIILATGSLPRSLGVPNEEQWLGAGLHYNALRDREMYVNQDVVVAGGGDAALEQALVLSETANRVFLVYRGAHLAAAHYLQERIQSNPKISVLLKHEVVELQGFPLVGCLVKKLDQRYTIPCKAVFSVQGRIPNTALFQNQLALNAQGYVVADQIGVPGVFIAGDISESAPRKMITSAASGATAALQAIQYLKSKAKD